MRKIGLALLLLAFALCCRSESREYIHVVAMIFEAESSQMPPNGSAALKSMLDDARRECLNHEYAAVVVEEVRALPLGRINSGPTSRTQQVAAVVREMSNMALRPYEGSLSPDSERARRLGLKVNQVLVELNCRPRGT
jgi:hypothetical protein